MKTDLKIMLYSRQSCISIYTACIYDVHCTLYSMYLRIFASINIYIGTIISMSHPLTTNEYTQYNSIITYHIHILNYTIECYGAAQLEIYALLIFIFKSIPALHAVYKCSMHIAHCTWLKT